MADVDYNSMMAGAAKSQQATGLNASAAAEQVSPESAGQAVTLAPQANMPATAIMNNPGPVNDMVTRSNREAILKTNPSVARWANSDPANVAATQDDFGTLGIWGTVLHNLHQMLFVDQRTPPTGTFGQEALATAEDVPTEIGKQFMAGARDVGHMLSAYNPTSNMTPMDRLNTLLGVVEMTGPVGAIGQMGASPITGTLSAFPGRLVEQYTGVRRDVTGQLLSMLLPLGKRVPKEAGDASDIPPPGGSSSGGNDGPLTSSSPNLSGEFTPEVLQGDATPASSRGQALSTAGGTRISGRRGAFAGTETLIPSVETAEQNRDIISGLMQNVSESKTQARSPDLTSSFIRQETEGGPLANVNIPAKAIDDLYASIKGTPAAGDGLLGFDPDIEAKLAAARLQGGDVKFPFSDYVANMAGKPVGDALLDHIKFDDGTSVAEAQEIAKAKEENPFNSTDFADNPPQGLDSADNNINPKTGKSPFVVARLMDDGTVIKGKPGDIHTDLLSEAEREEPASASGKMGFIGDNEKFLTRAEASEAIKKPELTIEEKTHVNEITPQLTEALGEAKKSQYLNQLFTDPQAAGMTADQFKRYSGKIQEVNNGLTSKMYDLVEKQLTKERSADWQSAEAVRRPLAEDNIYGRQDIQARHYLSTGEILGSPEARVPQIKLDKGLTSKQYPGLELPNSIFGPKGASADEAAEFLGYNSGQHLVEDIANLEHERRVAETAQGKSISIRQHPEMLIRNAVKAHTRRDLGDLLTPENIQQTAARLVASQDVRELLHTQLRALADKAGLPFDKDTVKSEAARAFGELPVSDAIKPKDFVKLSGRNGREAEVALLKGDPRSAFRAKTAQLVNNHMMEQSFKLQKVFNSSMKRFSAVAKRQVIASVDQEYLDRAHSILANIGFALKRDPAELREALGAQSLGDWIDQKQADGQVVVHLPWEQKPINEMNVNNFLNARDTLTSILHVGRQEKQLTVLGQKMAFQDVLDKFAEQRQTFGDKYSLNELKARTPAEVIRSLGRKYGAVNKVMEFLFDQIDHNDPHGVMNEIINRPFQDAKHARDAMETEIATKTNEFAKSQPDGWEDSVNRRLHEPSLVYKDTDGRELTLIHTKKDLLSAMLHWGNPDNRAALVEGFGLPEETWQAAFDKHASKADWDFVQHVWDMSEGLWQKARAMYKNLGGISPSSVEPQAFTAAGETYHGGHAPLFYDPLLGKDVKAKLTTGQQTFMRSLPAKGYSIARTGYRAPLDLDFDLYTTRLQQMMHDVAFRPAVLNAQKFMKNQTVSHGLDAMISKEYKDSINNYIDRVANERMVDDRSLSVINNVLRGVRHNMVVSSIGGLVSTVQKHGLTALSKSIDEVGAVPFAQAIGQMQREGLYESWLKASAESPELARRNQTVDRDFQQSFQSLFGQRGWISRTQAWALKPVGISDKLSAVPTYLAAKNSALEKGLSEQDAIFAGEKAVRKAHGAGSTVDLPAILGTNSELMKLFTPFTTFMNNSWNRLTLAGADIGAAKTNVVGGNFGAASRDIGHAFARTVMVAAFPAVVSALVKREVMGSKSSFLVDWAKSFVEEFTGGLPILNSIVADALDGRDYSSNVLDQVINSTYKNGHDVEKAWEGQQLPHRWVQHTLNTIGYATGLPGGQAGKTGQYLYDVIDGRESPQGIGDFAHGLLFGPKGK